MPNLTDDLKPIFFFFSTALFTFTENIEQTRCADRISHTVNNASTHGSDKGRRWRGGWWVVFTAYQRKKKNSLQAWMSVHMQYTHRNMPSWQTFFKNLLATFAQHSSIGVNVTGKFKILFQMLQTPLNEVPLEVPHVQTVLYCTRSVSGEENEQLVKRVWGKKKTNSCHSGKRAVVWKAEN